MIDELRMVDTNNGLLIETEGFTKGIEQVEYWMEMVSSKVALCPSGAVVPDSFRLYEALEGGCYPIVDSLSPFGIDGGFWKLVFGEEELPFMLVNSWSGIKDSINFHNDVYPHSANRVYGWWQKYKKDFVYGLKDDIYSLSGEESVDDGLKDKITVIIPTSFIKSHPSTGIIEEVIKGVRERLPDSEIIITFDGMRKE